MTELSYEQERVIERIQKLHAKACSARSIGSTQEGETFAAAVQKMLIKYKLEMSDLEASTLDAREPVGYAQMHFTFGSKRRVPWTETLAAVVAEAHFCRVLVVPECDGLLVVGRPADRSAATYVFEQLRKHADRHSSIEAAEYKQLCEFTIGYTLDGFRESWLRAFVGGVAHRYKSDRAQVETEVQSTGVSLVRLSEAETAVDEFLKGNGFTTEEAPQFNDEQTNGDGLRAGRRAAGSAKIYNREGLSHGAGEHAAASTLQTQRRIATNG